MGEKLLFLTGKLAEERLRETVAGLAIEGAEWQVRSIGVKVAALMTEAIVKNRMPAPIEADRVIVPGRSRMDLASLTAHYGVPFELGPDELIDVPQYFGHDGGPPDFSQHDLKIFAEIIEAPDLSLEMILERARAHRAAGADVIDVGCQPGTAFPELETVVRALKAEGFQVSVDSGDVDELARGAKAGCDYVLSLDETSLDAIAGTDCVPILVPKPHGDLDSLVRAIDLADARGIAYYADAILDPIHFGFTTSIERYAQLRRLRPNAPILMGTGNLTELTDADSQGLTALLLGICSELAITAVLIVQVSEHTRRTVEEHDAARRLMYRAKADGSLPKGYGGGLLSLHELRPFPHSSDAIEEMARTVRDMNYRIEVNADGVHVYNKIMHAMSDDAFKIFPELDVATDGAHAFYLGYELAKAETALRLGKRYTQDEALDWGVAADARDDNLARHAEEGATLKALRQQRAEARKRKAARDVADGADGGEAVNAVDDKSQAASAK